MQRLSGVVNQLKAWWSKRQFHQESGQAIILIALAAVGLVAIMGLAIDGGRLLFLRRDTQNAADAAALAAARALCKGEDLQAVGLAVADINGFQNDHTDDWVTINNPPANADPTDECAICRVEVIVRGQIPSTFIGLVYGGPLESTSTTVGFCSANISGGEIVPELRALWGGANSCMNTVDFTGSTAYVVGGMHSNNDIHAGGTGQGGTVIGASSYSDNDGYRVPENANITWQAGEVNVPGLNPDVMHCGACFMGNSDPNSYPNVNPYQAPEKIGYPFNFVVSDYAPGSAKANEALAKGEYHAYTNCTNANDAMDKAWLEDNGLLSSDGTLADGIYYSACGIHVGQGVGGTDDLNGKVTFIAKGDIQIGGATHDLEWYIDELLAFTDAGGNQCSAKSIQFSGSENHWTGNVFAPHGQVSVSGSDNVTNGCVVSYTINYSGSSNSIICEPDEPTGQPGVGLTPNE